MTKKILAMFLSLVMMVLSIPAFPMTVHAESTGISELRINYDESIELTNAYEEDEFAKTVHDTVQIEPEAFSLRQTYLRYSEENGAQMALGGDDPISASREYYLQQSIYLKEGYDWNDEIKGTNVRTKSGDLKTVSIYVNGTLRTDVIVHYQNPLHIYIPLGRGKEGSFIKSVAIDQTPFSLQRGTNANLTATVAGNAEDKSVTWSVSGNNSEATTISADGALQIASDETADKVIVTATSVYDPRKSSSIEVTVTEDAPEISAVTFIEPVTGIPSGVERRLIRSKLKEQRPIGH